MTEQKLTPLEIKILNYIVRPSLSELYSSRMIESGCAQDLNFTKFLQYTKRFYKANKGKDWYRMVIESDIL